MKCKKYAAAVIFLFTFIFSITAYADVEYICMNLNYDGANHQYVNQKVNLYINGNEIKNLSMPPVIFNNYTLVPAREVFEEVGAEVQWDNNTYTVAILYNNKKISLKIGDINAVVNDVSTPMAVPAKIINNKTMIPLRFVSSSAGLDVSWDAATRTAYVNEVLPNITSVTPPQTNSDGKFIINADKEINEINPMLLTENGKRLVIDINKSNIKTSSNDISVTNFAVSKVRFGQNGNVARTVFDLKGDFQYTAQISSDKKGVVVEFINNSESDSEKTSETNVETSEESAEKQTESAPQTALNTSNGTGDIKYDALSTSLSIKKNGGSFNLDNIEHIDDYNNGVYKVILYGDYGGFIKNTTVSVNDHNFSEINISAASDAVTITFNEKSILAFDVMEDAENIYINAMKPKSKYKNIVVLDAGHGGQDVGAVSQGYVEKEITLDIVNRIMALLESDPNIKGYATRTTDVKPSFDDRSNMGNSVGDMFISVHINSASSEKANGTEVFYYSAADVSSERGISSSILAAALQKNLVETLGSTDRKVKREDFIVLRQSTVPATLCEIGFITNAEEGAKLNSPEYRQLAAEAIYKSIKELFSQYPGK